MEGGRAVPVWVKRAIVWFWLGGLAVFYLVGVVRALSTLLVVLAVSLFWRSRWSQRSTGWSTAASGGGWARP